MGWMGVMTAGGNDAQKILRPLIDWLSAGRSYSKFRERYPEFSEWDIGAAIHSLPTRVAFPAAKTPQLVFGAHALILQLQALYGVFRDPMSDNRRVAERALFDEWAVDLFLYCRQEPQSGLRYLAMLHDAEARTALALAKEGYDVSLAAMTRLRDWRKLAMQLPPAGFTLRS